MPTEYREIQKHELVEDLDPVQAQVHFLLSLFLPALLCLTSQSLTGVWDSSV